MTIIETGVCRCGHRKSQHRLASRRQDLGDEPCTFSDCDCENYEPVFVELNG